MDVKLDTTLIFPVDDPFYEGNYNKLFKYCGSPEDIENNFKIELSCGDGKYLSDFWKWTEGGALVANWPDTPEADEELAKYDGEVCLKTPPRFRPIKMSMVPETMKPNKLYRFTIKYFPKTEEEVYYINGKQRNRKWVG